jgi:plasmid stabilization system protein ParE
MRIRWTVEARSDLVRLHEFLASHNRQAAARVVRRLRSAPSRLLQHNPRLGSRLDQYGGREVRRVVVDDYEIRGDTIMIANLWHAHEDR